MLYSDLVQRASDLSEIAFTSGSAASGPQLIDKLIDAAEVRIYSDVNFPQLTTVSSTSVTSGSNIVQKPSNPICFVVRSVRGLTTSGDQSFLQQKNVSFAREFWPSQSAVSTPLYWTDFNDTSIMLTPTPDSSIPTLEFLYTYRPPQLSYSNTSTWVSINAPRLMLYATMVEISTYLKQVGDPQGMSGMAARYDALYAQSIAALKQQLLQTGGDSFRMGDFG